jgi:5-carboxymethyl-2-hydroxymuconate isomerase
MPHIVVEHAPGILDSQSAANMLAAMHAALSENAQATIDPDRITSRVYVATSWRTGVGEGAFVHVTLRLLPGRSAETRKALTAALQGCARHAVPAGVRVTAEALELDAAAYCA